MRHAQLRNTAERISGVLMKRFAITRSPTDYPFDTQVKILYAATALHNFIKRHSEDNELNGWQETEEERNERLQAERTVRPNAVRVPQIEPVVEEDPEMVALRDNIAQKMWRDREKQRG